MKLKNVLLTSILFAPMFMGATTQRTTASPTFPILGQTRYDDFTCSLSFKEERINDKDIHYFYYEYEIRNTGEGYMFDIFACRNDSGIATGEEKDSDSFIAPDSTNSYKCIIPGATKTYCFDIPLKHEDNFEICATAHQSFASDVVVNSTSVELDKYWGDDGYWPIYIYNFNYDISYTTIKNYTYHFIAVVEYNGKEYPFHTDKFIAHGELNLDELHVVAVSVFELKTERHNRGMGIPTNFLIMYGAIVFGVVFVLVPIIVLVVLTIKNDLKGKEKQS